MLCLLCFYVVYVTWFTLYYFIFLHNYKISIGSVIIVDKFLRIINTYITQDVLYIHSILLTNLILY